MLLSDLSIKQPVFATMMMVALAVLGVAYTWQLAVYGFVILLAVTVDAVIRRELRRATTGE